MNGTFAMTYKLGYSVVLRDSSPRSVVGCGIRGTLSPVAPIPKCGCHIRRLFSTLEARGFNIRRKLEPSLLRTQMAPHGEFPRGFPSAPSKSGVGHAAGSIRTSLVTTPWKHLKSNSPSDKKTTTAYDDYTYGATVYHV